MSRSDYEYDSRQRDGRGGVLQHEAEHTRSHKQSSALAYLAILFGTAFLLLLMSYFIQQRQNAEATSDALKQSASATETLRLMQEENLALKGQASQLETLTAELREQVQALEQQVEELNSLNTELDSARRIQNENIAAMSLQADAMQWFWQIDDYYTRGYRTIAKKLIQQFEALGLHESLPTENTTPTTRFSPAQRYQEIRNALY